MKNRFRILLTVLAILLLGIFFLNKTSQSQSRSERTTVLFYHEMNGPAATALNELVKEYNHSQKKYRVVAEYQGAYNEAVEKFINTHGTRVSPAIFQSMDISTTQIAQSGYITPIQHFMNQDHYHQGQIFKAARSFYSHKGQQLSMPFNVSQPVLYYNKTLFSKYHVPDLPLRPSYADITRAAEKLYHNSHHEVKGISVETYGWLFEEFLANNGVALTNRENGHTGTSNRFVLDSQPARTTMKWLQNLNQSGALLNYGQGNNAEANEMAGFMAHKIGMFLQSSTQLVQIQNGNHDRIGVCFYPHETGRPANGVAIGGASLWISNDHSKKVQEGAWKFIKYLDSPTVQAKWAIKTGYIAVNYHSAKSKYLKKYFASHPAARVASQQLKSTQPNNYNSGTFIPGLLQDRIQVQNMMDRIYDGGNIPRDLKATSKDLSRQLQAINLANHH